MRPLRLIAFVAIFRLVLGAASAASAADVPATLSGKVFLDANGNGKPDAAEKGLSGIRVTDGVNFVATGQDGSYTITLAADPVIPYKPSQVVAVSWPSGKWPTGQWWARLDQVADAAHVDFGLREDKQALPFTFLHISDDHGNGWSYGVIGPRIKELGGSVKLCFNTGDMGYADPRGGDAMFTSIRERGRSFPVPMFFTPGNHDMVKQVPRNSGPLAGAGAFTKYLGPIRWSFDYAGVHFVSIDWWDPDIKVRVDGSVPQVAADWLEKDLADLKPGTRILLFVHFPTGCRKYYDLIAKYKVTHIFGGHNHRHAFYNFAGVPAVTTVNPETSGSGNLGVATRDAVNVVFYCNGGKHGSNYHGKRCGLHPGWSSKEVPAPTGTPGRGQSVAGLVLENGTKALDAGPGQGVSVSAEFAPGTAKRVGFRLGTGAHVEVVFTGQAIEAAGALIPFTLLPHDAGTVRLQFTIGGGLMALKANSRIRMAKPKVVNVNNPAAVTLFAEGGKAEFKKVDITGLK